MFHQLQIIVEKVVEEEEEEDKTKNKLNLV